MRHIKLLLIIGLSFLASGCYSLMPVSVHQPDNSVSIKDYRFFYVIPTSEVSSVQGSTYGNNYGVYGSTSSKSINPADEIAGYLISMGHIRIPQVDPNFIDNTMIVSYGVTGRRQVGIEAYTTEITIQFLSAKDYKPICTYTAEGIGSTETDDIRKAIERIFVQMLPPARY